MVKALGRVALLGAALGVPAVAQADIAPRSVEVMMTAVVSELRGGGIVRRSRNGVPSGVVRSFDLSELPSFPLAPGTTLSLLWRVSGDSLLPFFDENGLPICEPFLLAGVSAGPPRGTCTNSAAQAVLIFTSIPFADRLEDEPQAAGPNLYLSSSSLDLNYIPSTFTSPACCNYDYDWDDEEFTLRDGPGLFERTGLPHAAEGAFTGRRGFLDYRFDIDGDDVEGQGNAMIWFDVTWRYRDYGPTGVPAPASVPLIALGLGALALRRRAG